MRSASPGPSQYEYHDYGPYSQSIINKCDYQCQRSSDRWFTEAHRQSKHHRGEDKLHIDSQFLGHRELQHKIYLDRDKDPYRKIYR